MKILVTGSTGFIGSSLVKFLEQSGHVVNKLVRKKPKNNNEFLWIPLEEKIDKKAFNNINVVIHLAGENVFGFWTKNKKKSIVLSRNKSTLLLSKTIHKMKNPPSLLISASATGYYGNNEDKWLDEESEQGEGFLAEVCKNWENATKLAEETINVRVIKLRVGIVLGKEGGALKKMLLPFKLGLGGRLGTGKQYVSWIALDDVIGIINYCIFNKSIKGVVNASAPNPVTNLELTKSLGKILKRPTILPVPMFPFKLLVSEMAKELFFSGARAKPKTMLDAGYQFQYPLLEDALKKSIHGEK